MTMTWKIGELAKLTGLSVRTLHYYEEIDLLRASGRTEGSHRVYDEADLERLQRILSLRQLGFALEDVKACLDRPEYAIGPLIDLHLARLEAELATKRRVHQRLARLRAHLQADGSIPVTHLIEALEANAMLENHLTPDQVQAVHDAHAAQADGTGPDLRTRWADLFAALRAHLEAGDAPTSEPVLALARAWRALSHESTKGDVAMARNVATMYRAKPEARARVGLADDVWAYASQALAVEAGDGPW